VSTVRRMPARRLAPHPGPPPWPARTSYAVDVAIRGYDGVPESQLHVGYHAVFALEPEIEPTQFRQFVTGRGARDGL
jgi:hypothetical protein